MTKSTVSVRPIITTVLIVLPPNSELPEFVVAKTWTKQNWRSDVSSMSEIYGDHQLNAGKMLFSHHVICLYSSLWKILVKLDQGLSDLNFTRKKRGKSQLILWLMFTAVFYAIKIWESQLHLSIQIYRTHLNASSGYLKGTAPFVATPLRGSTASVRKKGSRTRNQENLPAFVCRFKLKHRFAFSAPWATKCQHADQRIVSIPTFRTWAVKTKISQIINHPNFQDNVLLLFS